MLAWSETMKPRMLTRLPTSSIRFGGPGVGSVAL